MLFNIYAIAAITAAVTAAPHPRAAGLHTTPLRRVSKITSFKNIVEKGFNKLQLVNSDASSASAANAASGAIGGIFSGTVTNDDVSYLAAVNIGGSVQNLIIDTGSSNTWCGAHTACEQPFSSKSTGDLVSIMYGSGGFIGSEYIDQVSFGGLTVAAQSIGSAVLATGFTGVDGIFGFGPVDLTANTVFNTPTVPTFMDNLFSQGSISTEVLGVYFAPEAGSDTNDANGELTLGGTDSSKYTGALKYFPKLTTGAAAPFWGLAISSFTYGTQVLASNSQGIIDTGTTLIYIPTPAYQAFLTATGGMTDTTSMLAEFPTAPTQNFTISFGSTPFVLTPAQYLVPQAQYSEFMLTTGKYYSWINDGGSSGVDCIIGQKFLENYYSAYDTTNSRIGFAPRK